MNLDVLSANTYNASFDWTRMAVDSAVADEDKLKLNGRERWKIVRKVKGMLIDED